ncbi:sensor histidine kinase [Paenibacillus cremeus]|uniref:histidine kinase n=1 Tax=Paenibacillus cremeus TaxID=2163881 RepID=A0A559K4F7_9BACL|nr:HAMP domain-containing sensor histidine kinase [Paenibacillus cremeus]TVY07029.1 HAMP domain-containing protein [Paenibacillus cremeus]
MSVRAKLFIAMTALVIFTGFLFMVISQVYLANLLERYADVIQVSQKHFHQSLLWAQLKGVLISILVMLLIGVWLSQKLTKPLHQITDAIKRFTVNDFSVSMQLASNDEYSIRTPLAIISGQLELFQENGKPIPPEMLLPMQDEVMRLAKLVNELHLLSMADAGKLSLDKEPVNLLDLVEGIVNIYQYELDGKRIETTVQTTLTKTTVSVDRNRMKQVLMNVLNNAIQYTGDGGKIRIELGDYKKSDDVDTHYVCVSIEDSGIGIAPEHLTSLFRRFYRVEDARNRDTGGTGLGLAIAKEFVEAHQGFITVESTIEKGTTFRIYLPSYEFTATVVDVK